MELQSLEDFSVVKRELASLEASSVEHSQEIKVLHQQIEKLKGEEAECSAQIPALLTSIGLLESTISDYEAVVEAYNESLSETSKVALGREKVSCKYLSQSNLNECLTCYAQLWH